MTKLYIVAGPEMGQSFELKDGTSFIGRAPDNEIIISDKTISRKHVKIVRKEGKYFVTDLESRNGTFFDGKYLQSFVEVQVREGIPIAIGLTVICIGEDCKDDRMLFSDLIQPSLTREIGEPEGVYADRRKKNNQKELEVFYKVSDVLMANLPLKETLQKILDYLLDLLKRIERGGFILLDPKGGEIGEIIFRSRTPSDDAGVISYRDVVNRVVKARKPLLVSDVQAEKMDGITESLELSKIQSMMCFPLIKESQVIGAVYMDSRERPHAFRKEDRSLFMDLCQRICMAIDYARLASHFDTLRLTQGQFES